MIDYSNEITKALTGLVDEQSRKLVTTNQQLREQACNEFAEQARQYLVLNYPEGEALSKMVLELSDTMGKLK